MINMTNKELVEIYNAIADKPIAAWKGKKTVLIEKIEALKADIFENGLDTENCSETVSEVDTDNAASDVAEETTEAAPVTVATGSEPTIRATAIELLCYVAYYENKDEKASDENRVSADHPSARSVGLPYNEVLDGIMIVFPEAKTSVACLRWYSVKIRGEELGYEGLRLCQRRPRVKK